MTNDLIVELGRKTLQEVALLAAPVLVIAMVVSLIVNIIQVLTSLQEQTIAAVPRLLAASGAVFFLLPWLMRHLTQFTLQLFTDFRPYLQ